MLKEGQFRNPSGCAIAAMISKDGKRFSGEKIVDAMRTMHDRSNGLGGGFAGYGTTFRTYYSLINAKVTGNNYVGGAYGYIASVDASTVLASSPFNAFS